MEKYTFIDMFDKLDPALLEGLHMEKDLGRHETIIRKLLGTIKNKNVDVRTVLVVSNLLLLGMLLMVIGKSRAYNS